MSNFILPKDIEVKKETLELWKGKNHYFHEKESAEYELAVGRKCSRCGKPTTAVHYHLCNDCIEAERIEDYNSMPFKEWDGKTPLVIFQTDIYFYDEDGIVFYCEDNGIDNYSDLHLVICEKVQLPIFEISEFIDDTWDWEYDIPNEGLINKEINDIIHKYLSDHPVWEQGKYRTTVEE